MFSRTPNRAASFDEIENGGIMTNGRNPPARYGGVDCG